MDHQTFAQLLGNYGEFIGAIAVILTLGYLIVQVQQNTKMLKATVYGMWYQSAAPVHVMRADNAELYGPLYDEPNRKFEDLSPAERVAHDALFTQVLNTHEANYLNYLNGAIDQSVLEAKRRNLVWLFSQLSLFERSWNFYDGALWDKRFVDFINSEVLPSAAVSASQKDLR